MTQNQSVLTGTLSVPVPDTEGLYMMTNLTGVVNESNGIELTAKVIYDQVLAQQIDPWQKVEQKTIFKGTVEGESSVFKKETNKMSGSVHYYAGGIESPASATFTAKRK